MMPGTEASYGKGSRSAEEEQELLNQLLTMLHTAPLKFAVRYTVFASLAVLVWDYILTFADEVKYIWHGRKSWPAFLFFVNRYFPIFAMSFNAAAQLLVPPNDLFCKFWIRGTLTWTRESVHLSVSVSLASIFIPMLGRVCLFDPI
ncbi:hypothetical protein BKA62DRAFT_705712 [Auriculariales sp. MPI-PUGE-AT-0066]|nr:hypothetical protein BKA62DRAFT_705712 [Auriculariales sp. MPI-PUGE-AT-0066]